MDVKQVLHMNGGSGDTSYARNSTIQSIIASLKKEVRQSEAVESYRSSSPDCLKIAELGCSSGKNALLVASEIIDAVEQNCLREGCSPPDFLILLNDLPSNDFNSVFSLLSDQLQCEPRRNCFAYGVPGSFYGRLFPSQSLDFVHSSSSLHWLSQVPRDICDQLNAPLNKGKLYISKTTPDEVLEAYYSQFEEDFSHFLKCRAEEMVDGGRMMLTFMGRRIGEEAHSSESCYHWDLLAQALMDMTNEGFFPKEKVDSFDAPYYAPSVEEVKKVVLSQGCFTINVLEAFAASWNALQNDESGNGEENREYKAGHAGRMANCVRAVAESMLVSHFEEHIMEEVFNRYQNLLEDYYLKNKPQVTNVVVSLVRNPRKAL
uniref:Jasmonic acid carboxyl methyltransferase n=1 Tax=Cymbidium ensifolium TaxID=78740 RepID=I0DHG9_CYMEN|nr:jasmonic acid carboxyl methyltransferase [Cymbidium ensifolium]